MEIDKILTIGVVTRTLWICDAIYIIKAKISVVKVKFWKKNIFRVKSIVK